MPRVDKSLVFENARITRLNFQGKEGPYNKEGDMNFLLVLPDDLAEAMKADGWNVKEFKPQEGEEEGEKFIQVAVEYRKGRPPNIVLITGHNRTLLTENEVELLDWIEVEYVDLIVNPYNWNVRGETGVKAYLKDMFITPRLTVLDRKYADYKEIDRRGQSPLQITDTPHEDEYIDAEYVEEEEPQ